MPNLTRQKAEAHEALYPALESLTRQLEAMAARKPSAPVPAATRAIAADLMFEAQRFAGLRRGLVETAADLGGLATQLGRALAQLDAFEAAQSAWYPDLGCFAWQLRDPLPVKRLRPETIAIVKSAKQQRHGDEMRRKILARINERFDEGYREGYADASSGREQRGRAV